MRSESDNSAPHDIDAVAGAILDGTPVDWTHPLPAEPALLDELRVLSQIAAVHRSALSDPPCTSLQTWGHLTLIERIGRGTSGEVFLAIDNRLQRSVALKLLFPNAAPVASPTAAIDEACMLARVRHPNVVTVFGAEAIDGRIGIITEHIDGRTLADVLRDEGPRGADEASATGMVLCRALAAVHQAGLVHRDIKAQNVMREEGGRLVLMDIGAGHRLGGSPTNLSGTPLYVAPEVLAGAPATTHSDLYSLGVLLFHLVTGGFPVSGESLHAIQNAHRLGVRTRLRELRPNLPTRFTFAVERALASDPDNRFSSAAEMEEALAAAIDSSAPRVASTRRRPRRAALALAAAVAAAAGGAAWIAYTSNTSTAASAVAFQSREWVLVVPFENRTGNTTLDGALEHAFNHALSTSAYVNVVPPERVDDALRLMRLPPSAPLDARRAREVAARDGNVRVILAGSVGYVGGIYPITVNVIDPSTGGVLASAREEPREESHIPDAIRKLSSWVRLTLGEASRQVAKDTQILEKATTPSLAALQDYSAAMKATRDRNWALAETWLKAATAKDPEFASAQIWLAWAQSNLSRASANPSLRGEALRSAQRAVDLVSNTTPRERHFILGSNFLLRNRTSEAAAEFEALLTLYPDDYWGQHKLYQAALQTMSPEKVRELTLRGAAARPHDPNSQLRAATEVLRTDLPAARSYFARALELGRASGALDANDLLYASLFRVHALWTERRIADAEKALAEVERLKLDGRDDWAILPSVTFRLTFGQPNAAGPFSRHMASAEMQVMAQALVALARQDMAAIPRLLRRYRFYDVVGVSLLIRAGRVDEAERLLGRLVTQAEALAHSAAEIAVARGDLGEPKRKLHAAIVRLRFAGARSYLYTETLADALAKAGDVQGAIRILEDQVAGGHGAFSPAGSVGYLWMRCAKKLAEAYRRGGRIADAQRIESDLLAALSHAEPDFPLVVELRRLQGR